MNTEIERVQFEDKFVLQNLLELCQHDYSEFEDKDLNSHGLFGYRYLDHYWTEEGRAAIIESIPLGRIGLPEDCASAACFLLSDLANFVTGSTITVDGGFDMRG